MKFLRALFSVLSTSSLKTLLAVKGTFVGVDGFGNRYYKSNARKGYAHERRYVVYKTGADSSTVPAEWHGWLHHQTNTFPSAEGLSFRKPWQLPAVPNLTGTPLAYRPQGHQLMGGQRPKATGDYTAWRPKTQNTSK